jgi:hypothetical protein
MSRYTETAAGIASTVEAKQAAYGDSFGRSGEVLRALYPDGIPVAAYDDALYLIRTIDKLFRIAASKGQPDPMAENPARDIAGYALLHTVRCSRDGEVAQ